MPLKYFFTATFADGHTIVQTEEDKSVIDPEKRSAFYDVLAYAEKVQLVKFKLEGFYMNSGGHDYAVDLIDGHFEVNGIPFRMHEDQPTGFELIFFRQHTHTFNVGRSGQKEMGHDIVYRMGWKVKGSQNYQRVMQID